MAKRVTNIALGLILAAVAITLVAVAALPRTSGWRFLTVLSPSMSPTLDVGGVVAVRPADAEAIGPGDIVVYSAPGHKGALVTHRVVEVVADGGATAFRTRGDANNVADSYLVPAKDLVGQVAFHVPLVGYLLAFVRTPVGFLATVVAPGLALVSMEVMGLARQAARSREGSPAGH